MLYVCYEFEVAETKGFRVALHVMQEIIVVVIGVIAHYISCLVESGLSTILLSGKKLAFSIFSSW
jgi:hypothetical protein